MKWLSIIFMVLKLASGLLDLARRRSEINELEADALERKLESSRDLVTKMRAARDAAVADFDKRGGVPDEKDPFLRD